MTGRNTEEYCKLYDIENIIGTEVTEDGLRLGHTWYEIDNWFALIEQYKPEHFVEIGVHEGAFSRLIISRFYQKLHYIGIEYNCAIVRPEVLLYYNPDYNSELWDGDCFSPEMKQQVKALVGKKIIYCDGGNKARELRVYSHYVNSGDLLFSHDYNDGKRSGYGLPEVIKAEVLPKDVKFLNESPKFTKLEEIYGTRIIGYQRN